MSREIKFRTWIKDEKKYIPDFVEDNDAGDGYGPLEYDNYYLAPETGAIVKHHNHREFGDWMYSVEGTNANREVEVEQYTGLKDKNGKEIYEGDIVDIELHFRTGNEHIKGIVEFDYGCFSVKTIMDEHIHPLHIFTSNTRASVIGNVHENKELLEGEE